MNFCIEKSWKFGITLLERVLVIFVLNAAHVFAKNEMLEWTTYWNLIYPSMKEILKKVFANILWLEYNAIPLIKEEMEAVNFKQYKDYRGQKS